MIVGVSTRPPADAADLLPPDLCARLDALDLHSRRVFAGKLQGERRSKRRGRSVEFEEHREYVPGDDLRHIDWNVYARLDRFFIKLFQEEEDLGLEIVLDASASMHSGGGATARSAEGGTTGEPVTPSKILFASRLAAALGYVGLVRNNRVSLSIIGLPGVPGGMRRLNPLRGRRNVRHLAAFLIDHAFTGGPSAEGAATVAGGAAFTQGCRRVASVRLGKGVVVLLSDLLIPPPEGYAQGIRALAAPTAAGTAFDVHCVQVLSPGELDPAREGRGDGAGASGPIIGDLALTDAETGRAAEVTVTGEVLDAYRRAVTRYLREAAAFCAARGATHQVIPSDADAASIVLDSLRRRGVLT